LRLEEKPELVIQNTRWCYFQASDFELLKPGEKCTAWHYHTHHGHKLRYFVNEKSTICDRGHYKSGSLSVDGKPIIKHNEISITNVHPYLLNHPEKSA
jgi:hypothetical protein